MPTPVWVYPDKAKDMGKAFGSVKDKFIPPAIFALNILPRYAMKIKPYHILLALLMISLAGCGLFRSTTKTDARTDSTTVKNKV
ncbi:hypothetical protein [Fodinibius sp.]|uniref:hypothetical protein n=1 Tax=Fodinibius sp. TaxID=1872440 RepID=UPI002ACE7AC2|nr:hypothetical protein [Fodinibius sp.]MDZ7658844.1 hypothetical protein [Fodinibius sp.]